jgi:hypothetical protein
MSWRSMLMATAVAAANPELEEGAPDAVEITQEDARDIRMMVREQLAAFRGGDAARAWRLCSRNIHQAFERPEKLMELIRARYHALIDPIGLSFGAWTLTPEGLGLLLDVRSAEGEVHRALFLVVKEREVGWRINGALLVGGPEEALAEAA